MDTAPEVRQCQDTTDPNYGAVAVQSGVNQFAWGVFHPVSGGHWDTNDEITKTWTVLT